MLTPYLNARSQRVEDGIRNPSSLFAASQICDAHGEVAPARRHRQGAPEKAQCELVLQAVSFVVAVVCAEAVPLGKERQTAVVAAEFAVVEDGSVVVEIAVVLHSPSPK